jgi:hypothetical protein
VRTAISQDVRGGQNALETPPSVLNVERKLSIGFDLERFFVVNLYVSPPPTCWTISNARQGFQYCNLGITALRLFRSTIVVMSSSYTRLALRRIGTRFGSIRPKHRPGGRLNVAAHRLPSGI